MQFTTVLASLLAATMASASPVAQPDVSVEAASQPLIDLWQDPQFLGLKFTGSANVGDCKDLTGTGFQDNVSSGKAKPGFRCTIWVDVKCQGTGFSFNESPGAATLPSWIDNKASSWKCVKA